LNLWLLLVVSLRSVIAAAGHALVSVQRHSKPRVGV
jgi:hypothetical protein